METIKTKYKEKVLIPASALSGIYSSLSAPKDKKTFDMWCKGIFNTTDNIKVRLMILASTDDVDCHIDFLEEYAKKIYKRNFNWLKSIYGECRVWHLIKLQKL